MGRTGELLFETSPNYFLLYFMAESSRPHGWGVNMIHQGTREIHTDRLILRRFTLDDANEMLDRWANDAEVTQFLSWQPHGTIEVTKAVVNDWVNAYSFLNVYHWGIVYDNQLIGSISLLQPNDELAEAEAGYCLSRGFWGKGIMAEALSAVIDYAFSEVGFQRIHAKHDIRNPNSGKVMQKCGMKYIETAERPLALKPDRIKICDCYEILNTNRS